MVKGREVETIVKRLDELKELISDSSGTDMDTYLTGTDVEKMLRISTSTLQTWRTERTIPYTAIRNKFFYRLGDIHVVMEKYKVS